MQNNDFVENIRRDIMKQNGNVVVENLPPGHNQCPSCAKVYAFSKPYGEGEAWEREQHMSGFCSDECWPFKQ